MDPPDLPIKIGTSGWHYKHWNGTFYPADTDAKDFLAHYIRTFDTVELNVTFYRLPKPETARHWAAATPPGFIFAVKASRFITHIKRLKEPEATLPPFLKWTQRLTNKCGPRLIQLPPRWNVDAERLKDFLKRLPRDGPPAVMEFRDPSWFTERVYQLLADHGVALCIYHRGKETTPEILTSNVVYIRFHGLTMYQGNYPAKFLKTWAHKIERWHNQKKAVYAYFNNDAKGFAPKNAALLLQMLGKPVTAAIPWTSKKRNTSNLKGVPT
jgi:uncharacterized protein YecE (DUF72 family)